MLSGSLVVPNVPSKVRKPRRDFREISREFPYGGMRDSYDDVKILYVCHDKVHRDLVAHTFKDRAMYICEGAAITGRRFDHIILFERPFGTRGAEQTVRWYHEYVMTSLTPGGEYTRYSIEQQLDLGIYAGYYTGTPLITGIDLAGPNSDHTAYTQRKALRA